MSKKEMKEKYLSKVATRESFTDHQVEMARKMKTPLVRTCYNGKFHQTPSGYIVPNRVGGNLRQHSS